MAFGLSPTVADLVETSLAPKRTPIVTRPQNGRAGSAMREAGSM
jgi:hypothetical protein